MKLTFYRAGNWLHRHHLAPLGRVVGLLGRVVTGASIPSGCTIGPGTTLGYGGSGVVVHKRAVIGANCLISPGVVIGGRSGHHEVPVIEDDVKLYPGAKVLGPIRIGRGASIGPNAVVVKDVPAGAVMVAPLAVALPTHTNGAAAAPSEPGEDPAPG